jgi:transcriptional regulator with XRE-family HTH domain
MNWKKLFKTDTYWIERIQSDLYEMVRSYLDANHITQEQFGKRIGVSKGRVSQILRGSADPNLSTIVRLHLAVGKVPLFHDVDLGAYIDHADSGFVAQTIFVRVKSGTTTETNVLVAPSIQNVETQGAKYLGESPQSTYKFETLTLANFEALTSYTTR